MPRLPLLCRIRVDPRLESERAVEARQLISTVGTISSLVKDAFVLMNRVGRASTPRPSSLLIPANAAVRFAGNDPRQGCVLDAFGGARPDERTRSDTALLCLLARLAGGGDDRRQCGR